MMNRLKIFIAAILLMVKVQAQVNLQTGSATFSLPMFSWQDDKSRLASIVALSYNSGSGLRVNDIASNVGQGWNLIAGGEIVRMQAGEPDDQVKRDGSDFDISKYPSGILYASVPVTSGAPSALTKYPIFGNKDQLYAQHNALTADRELDYFTFQFNGKSGMFILDTDPANIGVALPLGDTKMKITYQQDAGLINQGIRTKITSFTIKDVDGLIYKFAKHGMAKALRTSYCDRDYNYKQTSPKIKNDKVFYQSQFEDAGIVNPWVIGSWHLTEIEDALTLRKIFFNYSIPRIMNNVAGYDISFNDASKHYCIVTRKISITKTPDLESIVYPDGHLVSLNYKNTERIDLRGAFAISSVDIKYQSRYLSKYQLNSTYFILNRYGNPVTAYQKKVARLCLLSVKKIGVDLKEDTPPYVFDYYTGSSEDGDFVPPPFFYAKDIFGFYNGTNSKGFWNEDIPLNSSLNEIDHFNKIKGLCFLRNNVSGIILNAKPQYARNGLLKQIIYPTGGTLSYEYLQNKGILNSVNTDVGGVHVSKTSSTDGGYSNGCDNPIVINYNYVLEGGAVSSLWGLEMPENSVYTENHYQPEWKSYKWSPAYPLGKCYWHFSFPGIMAQQQAINLSGVQKAMEALSPVMGILSVLGTIQDVATVIGGGSPVSLIINLIVNLAEVAITCFGNGERNTSATVYFNFDLNSAAPLPTQFKRVEVIEGSGTIGKTVQEFTSSSDYPIWEPDNPIYAAKQRFAPWAYGLPDTTTVYDVSGNKIKQTINFYDYSQAKNILNKCPSHVPNSCDASPIQVRSFLLGCKIQVAKSSSMRATVWTNIATNNPGYIFASTNDIKVDFYGMYSGRTMLTSTSERIYKTGSATEYTETLTSYLYNDGQGNTNYEPRIITTKQSNGDENSKFIKYSGDYTGGALSTLVQNNILSLPVSTYTYVLPNGGLWNDQKCLGEKVTEFTQLSNGDIKPSRILEQRFSQPVPIANLVLYGGPGSDISNYKIPQTFSYDNATGILKGVKDEGGRTISNIYGYDDKYVVASVINADPSVDKTAYTSFENSNLVSSNWTLTGSSAYVTTNGVTGTSSFAVSAGNSLSVSGLNTLRPYIVSFWATSGGITVTGGATLSKSAPTINGFTYYEYDIAQGTGSVTVSGNGTIDELRLLPKTARMRTTTYDPLIGKTSECDDNGRITYYEYDNLGRLRFIKDENKNIVKMYEYNNISPTKQNGCPTTYYNKFISERFVKSNCGPGYRGDSITFFVAANIYTSTLSQADADAKAEIYLLTNGQAYANSNATCKFIYYNTLQSRADTTQTCAPGYKGGTVTYTVPAGRYSSIVSQAEANEMALDELEANAQAYANDPAHANCIINSDPDWTWLEGASYYCQSINGNLPPHLFVLETDMNPNSGTYQQTRWADVGPSDECPANNYYNSVQSGTFTKNDCPPGYNGSTVTYSVTGGVYNSTVSQAAADQLAINDVNANGQNYANTYGNCGDTQVDLYYNFYSSGYEYGNVEFYNNSTGQSYYFYVYSGYNTTYLGSLPSGSYTVTFYPDYQNYYHSFGVGCDYYNGGYGTITVYNVDISVSCNTVFINTSY